MTNTYYTPTGAPATSSRGSSATIRAEMALVATGFDKLPVIAGGANKGLIVNAAGTALIVAPGSRTYYVTDTFDGVTDNTASINATIATCMAAGGGTLVLPGGTCLMLGAMVIPYTGASFPTQPPLRITGAGQTTNGYWTGSPNGGTILDMRYSGGGSQVAAIDTRGAGLLQIDNLTIVNGGTNNYLFLQTTSTTVIADKVTFVGNQANSGTACTQNAIQLGGITAASSTLGGILATNGFQGYGSRITNCYFEHIQIAVGFGGSANAVFLDNNTVSASCGSGAAQGAPYRFYGVGLGASGNIFSGGIIEISHYPYGVAMVSTGATNNAGNRFMGLGMWDETPGAPTLGSYYFDVNSVYNVVVSGFNDPGLVILNGPGAASNSVIGNGNSSWFVQDNAVFAGNLSSTAQMGVGNSSPQKRLDVGDGAGDETIRINGGNSGAGAGPALHFSAAGALTAYLGFYSAYGGGAYNSLLYCPTNIAFGGQVAIGQGSGNSPRVALDVGDGTGQKFASVDGAASGAGNGAAFTVRNNGAIIGYFGNVSAYTGGAYSGVMLLNGIAGISVGVAGTTVQTITASGTQFNAAGIGFFGAAVATKPTVTGSRGANAALASLLTALAGLGLLTDSSS